MSDVFISATVARLLRELEATGYGCGVKCLRRDPQSMATYMAYCFGRLWSRDARDTAVGVAVVRGVQLMDCQHEGFLLLRFPGFRTRHFLFANPTLHEGSCPASARSIFGGAFSQQTISVRRTRLTTDAVGGGSQRSDRAN